MAFYYASVATPSYSVANTGSSATIRSLWAVSASSVWAVTADEVLHYDGASWAQVTTGFEDVFDFYNVAADSQGNVTIAGAGGNIIYGAIPEPGTLLLGAGGMLALLARRRMRG